MSSKSYIMRKATFQDMKPWRNLPKGFPSEFREWYWSAARGRDIDGNLIIVKGRLGVQPLQKIAELVFYFKGAIGTILIPWVNPRFEGGVWNINNYPDGDPSLQHDVSNPDNVVYTFRVGDNLIEYTMTSIGIPLWYSNFRDTEADLMLWGEKAWVGGFDEPRIVTGRIRTGLTSEITFKAFGLYEHAVSVDKPNTIPYKDSRWLWFGDKNFYGVVLESRDMKGEKLVKTGRFGKINISAQRLDNFKLNVASIRDPTTFHLVEGELWNEKGDPVGYVTFNPITDTILIGGAHAVALMTGKVSNQVVIPFYGVAGTERQLTLTSLKPCFIATAAYGTPLAPELIKLRNFRNSCLPKPLTNLYYAVSPMFAEQICKHEKLKLLTRSCLDLILKKNKKD